MVSSFLTFPFQVLLLFHSVLSTVKQMPGTVDESLTCFLSQRSQFLKRHPTIFTEGTLFLCLDLSHHTEIVIAVKRLKSPEKEPQNTLGMGFSPRPVCNMTKHSPFFYGEGFSQENCPLCSPAWYWTNNTFVSHDHSAIFKYLHSRLYGISIRPHYNLEIPCLCPFCILLFRF